MRRARWGARLALGLLVVNLLGDLLNAAVGRDPRALVGIPIAGALILYLRTRRVREYFEGAP
jgi:hypothetical protein